MELNASDVNALIARSKCYLLLGDPTKGLQVISKSDFIAQTKIKQNISQHTQDAESALTAEKGNIRALFQKAESLYFLGQFEHSLMFFHRGLRLRPELNNFRLGVQKTQEAIEKTIGEFPKKSSKSVTPKSRNQSAVLPKIPQPRSRPRTGKPQSLEKREARKLLGELCVDKEYLENLLKHPDLKRADTGSENVSTYAKEAVNFLNSRQEFWRQQRPCTALPSKKQLSAMGSLQKFF